MTRKRSLPVRFGALLLSAAIATGGAIAASNSTTNDIHSARGTLEDPVYLRQLAEGHYLDGDLEAAVRLYLEAARLSSEPGETSQALLNASWLQFLLGNKDSALAAVHAALRIDDAMEFDSRLYSPEFEKVYLKARVLIVREGGVRTAPRPAERPEPDPRTDAEAVYRQAVERIDRGDADAALDLLERAAALTYGADSGQLDLRRSALMRIGLLYFERGQWSDAATAFEEAVNLERDDVAAWKNLGLARLRQGVLPAAIEALREAYARQPGNLENARNLAQALVRSERWDDAVSWITDAVHHHGRDAHLRLLLATAQRGRGSVEQAIQAWRAAMEVDNSFDWEHGRKAALLAALAHFESGSHDLALEVAHIALARVPRDAAFWNLVGLSQQAAGDAGEARTSFLKACDYDDARAEYRNNLGRAYAAVGNLPEAEQAFVHALTLEPDLPAAQANLGQVRKLLRDRSGG